MMRWGTKVRGSGMGNKFESGGDNNPFPFNGRSRKFTLTLH